MIKLTSRQKELFHMDKHTLVDMITLLEHKLEKASEEIKFTKNEILLEGEAHIKAQQEMDSIEDDTRKLKRAMNDIEKCLDGAWEGDITADNFVETVTQIFTGDYYDKIREKSN